MVKTIKSNYKNLQYMGRIDFEDPQRPVFIWAGSNVRFRFKGTSLSVKLRNFRFYGNNSVGVILDGKEYKIALSPKNEDTIINIAENMSDIQHEVILFKRQDATHYFELLGFEISGEILQPSPLPKRKIECFGDSVSAGAVCEAVDFTEKDDPDDHECEYDNAWHSYAMITARNLGAQIYNEAQGGIAIFDGTGYYHAPEYIGMESAYDKLCYFPEGKNGVTLWNFKRYIPNVVLFGIGQNDNNNEFGENFDISDPVYRAKWKKRYKDIILSLQEKYPKAVFVLYLTVLRHDEQWDLAVEEIADSFDERVSYLKFKRAGKATSGHPRLSEQQEMAEELTAYLSNMGDKIWQ